MDSAALRDQLLHQNRPEDVRGFLSQVWEAHSSLPQQTPWERRKYFLTRGLEILLALPVSSIITTLTVAFSLALVGAFILLVSNVEEVVSGLGSGLSITAYLSDRNTQESIERIRRESRALPGVGSLSYTSKSEALAEFRDAMGERGELLSRFDSRSPLPASIELELTSPSAEVHQLVVNKLKEEPLIDEVLSGDDLVDRVSGLVDAIKTVGAGGGLFTFVIIVFLILNTIKLVIYSQRHEIEVMQLVGATQSTVRTPFLVAGALQGLFGAVIGVFVLRFLFWLIVVALEQTKLLGSAIPMPSFYSLPSIILFILVGVALGVVASAIAVGKHLESFLES
jgi:cell division transport system permease protein